MRGMPRDLQADWLPRDGRPEGLVEMRRRAEARRYLSRFKADEESHIRIRDQERCRRCPEKWCNYICPSLVYQYDDGAELNRVAWEGCVECGTCRIGCPYRNIDWQYPRGGFGIQHRYG